MIFYFSGTGNSKHVAECISKHTNQRMIPVSEDAIRSNETYHVEENEDIGFVFPVYWYTLPTIVEKFIKQLKISGYRKQYTYAVVTYGISGGNVMNRLFHILEKKQIHLHAKYGVKMVDNYVIGYDIADIEKQKLILSDAENEISTIISMIEKRENTEYIKKGKISFITPVTGYAYRKAEHTRKFYATEACNSCGQCAASCPCNTIRLSEGKPSWDGNCTFCLKCIHSCGQSAIQHGKKTENRCRYQYSL